MTLYRDMVFVGKKVMPATQVWCLVLQPGDRVLMASNNEEGVNEAANDWEFISSEYDDLRTTTHVEIISAAELLKRRRKQEKNDLRAAG